MNKAKECKGCEPCRFLKSCRYGKSMSCTCSPSPIKKDTIDSDSDATIKPTKEWVNRFNNLWEYSNWDLLTSVDELKLEYISFISSLLKEQKAELIEEIKGSFIKKFRGSGEQFFPYESEGNCTKEEELEAVEQEWQDILDLTKEKV